GPPLRAPPSRLSFWSTAPSPTVPDGSRWRTFSRVTVTRYELSRSLRRVSRRTWLRRAAFSIRQVLVCWSATVMAGVSLPIRGCVPLSKLFFFLLAAHPNAAGSLLVL